MKKLITYLALLCIYCNSYSQGFELSAGAGIIDYGGDLVTKSLSLKQAGPSFAINGAYTFGGRYFVAASVMAGKVAADDSVAGHANRNLSFRSNILEGALLFGVNLFDMENTDMMFSPYGFIGLGAFHYDPYVPNTAGEKVYLRSLGTEGQGLAEYPENNFYAKWSLAIPIGIGIKYELSNRMLVSAEVGLRKTFTDHLDDAGSFNFADTAIIRANRGDVASAYAFRADELPNSRYPLDGQRANPNKNDVYYNFLLKLTYRFGSSFQVFY